MSDRLPMVAIVGRVNVGKSTLFNRLLRSRIAIEHSDAGITRDNNYQIAVLGDRQVLLVDTGGFSWEEGTNLEDDVRGMAEAASREADVVVMLVDVSVPTTDEDLRLARLLQRGGASIVLVGNKADRLKDRTGVYDYLSLGLGEPVLCSAVHGHGVADLIDRVVDRLPVAGAEEPRAGVRVAIVGKPNVGKSSLVNALLGERRVLVHEDPGTTRDAVDLWLTRDEKTYQLVDTAGLRRRARVEQPVEYYSVLRALRAINRSQVCVLVLDADDRVSRQDARIASIIADSYKAAVVAANKWDLIRGDEYRVQRFEDERDRRLGFVSYAPFLRISTLTGLRLKDVLPTVDRVHASAVTRVETGPFNRFLHRLTERTPPPSYGGKEVLIRYGSQVGTEPPTFVLHARRPGGITVNYRRFLVNSVRREFGFEGTPIKIILRGT